MNANTRKYIALSEEIVHYERLLERATRRGDATAAANIATWLRRIEAERASIVRRAKKGKASGK